MKMTQERSRRIKAKANRLAEKAESTYSWSNEVRWYKHADVLFRLAKELETS